MGISYAQFLDMQARVKQGRKEPEPPSEGVSRESDLHDSIIEFCDRQWPRWKYIRTRMDKRSTIAVGAQDFTIFLPGNAEMAPRVKCIECKRKGEKPTAEQLIWHKEMEMLGHTVYVVRSMAEFMEVIK